jgi:hypothetical protein
VEGLFSLLAVYLPAVASELGHAGPSRWGWAVALASAPVVLAVDAADKWRRAGTRPAHAGGRAAPA